MTSQDMSLDYIRSVLAADQTSGIKAIAALIPPGSRDSLKDAFFSDDSYDPGDLRQDKSMGRLLIAINGKIIHGPHPEKRLDELSSAIAGMIAAQPASPHAKGPAAISGGPGLNLDSDSVERHMPAAPVKKTAPPAPLEPQAEKTSLGDQVRLRLFEDAGSNTSVPLISLLVPPPSCKDKDALERWINADPSGTGVAICLNSEKWMTQATDLEIEIYNDPEGVLSSLPTRQPLDEEMFAPLGQWVRQEMALQARDPGEEDLLCLKEAFEKVIQAYAPDHPGNLRQNEAEIVLSEDAGHMISFARDLEAHFLLDADPEMEPHLGEQHLLSSARPDRAFLANHVLMQAVGKFLVASVPLDAALGLSLIEMRDAQLRRRLNEGDDNVEKFDDLFFEDCRRPLESFIVEPCADLEM